MKKATALGLVLVAGCSAQSPSGSVVDPQASAPPVVSRPATHANVVSYFKGSADPAHGTFSIEFVSPPGGVVPESALIPPSGSGATVSSALATMHTVPGSVHYATNQCAALSLCGDVQALNHLAVAGTFYAYIDSYSISGISGGPWAYLNVAANGTSASQTWNFSDPSATQFSFIGHVEAVVSSCKVLHSIAPGAGSGVYEINPQGTTMQAYCDMSFDDGLGGGAGGWTLIESTDSSHLPSDIGSGVPTPSAPAFMPVAAMEAVAANSSQVYIVGQDGAWISSLKDGPPIQHLRNGVVLDDESDAPPGDGSNEVSLWTGTAADSRLNFSCPTTGETFPTGVFHACGNAADGFHLTGPNSTWHWQTANIAFQVYTR